MNEFLVEITSTTILLYSGLIGEPSIEYDFGWITVGLMVFTTLINFANVFYYLF